MIRYHLRWAFLLTLLCVLPVALIRAQPYDDHDLRAFLTPPEGCPAPCYMGIRPGVTTADEALAILENHEWNIDKLDIFESRNVVIDTWLVQYESRLPFIIYAQEDIVSGLRFPLTHLGDYVNALGSPDRVFTYATLGPGEQKVFLWYQHPNFYLELDLFLCDLTTSYLWNISGAPDQSWNRLSVVFTSPTDMPEPYNVSERIVELGIQNWIGGIYKLYYDSSNLDCKVLRN